MFDGYSYITLDIKLAAFVTSGNIHNNMPKHVDCCAISLNYNTHPVNLGDW